MKKIVYYNVDDEVDIEQECLDQWGVDDIELVMIRNGKDQHRPEAFLEAVKDADGVVVEYFQVTKDIIRQMDHTKIISVQAIGYNGIDTKAAAEKGIVVTNAPGFCTEEVAVHTVGMLIDCMKQITYLDRSVRAGKWDPLLAGTPKRLSGQTVGLISFGSIPQKVTPILKALGLNIITYEPFRTKADLTQLGAEKVDTVEALLKRSDFVSVHCPLIYEDVPKGSSTYHLLDEEKFKMMKPSAYFMNVARGEVVDEEALAKALKEGWIKGAAVDVIEDEDGSCSPLFGLPNCIITPHAAFVSEEAFHDARVIAIKQQVELLHFGNLPEHTVNRDVAGMDF